MRAGHQARVIIHSLLRVPRRFRLHIEGRIGEPPVLRRCVVASRTRQRVTKRNASPSLWNFWRRAASARGAEAERMADDDVAAPPPRAGRRGRSKGKLVNSLSDIERQLIRCEISQQNDDGGSRPGSAAVGSGRGEEEKRGATRRPGPSPAGSGREDTQSAVVAGARKSMFSRIECQCMATKHALVANCLGCGRVICEREGKGPCLTCGRPVGDGNAAESASGSGSAAHESAVALKNRLLHQQNGDASRDKGGNASRLRLGNHIYDDQADYFKLNGGTDTSSSSVNTAVRDDQTDYSSFNMNNYDEIDSNVWLDEDEREMLRREQEMMEESAIERRNQFLVTFDLESRSVLVDDGAGPNAPLTGIGSAQDRSTTQHGGSSFVVRDSWEDDGGDTPEDSPGRSRRQPAPDDDESFDNTRISDYPDLGGRPMPVFCESTRSESRREASRRFRDIVASTSRSAKTTTMEKIRALHVEERADVAGDTDSARAAAPAPMTVPEQPRSRERTVGQQRGEHSSRVAAVAGGADSRGKKRRGKEKRGGQSNPQDGSVPQVVRQMLECGRDAGEEHRSWWPRETAPTKDPPQVKSR